MLNRSKIAAALSAAALAVLLVGCGSSQEPQAAEHDHATHQHDDDRSFYQHADGTEANTDTYDSVPSADLKGLAKASDLVVRGQITKAQKGVLIAKGDPTAKYTVFTVKVSDTVRGNQAQQIDFALMTEISGSQVVVEDRPTPSVGSEVILTLTKIAPEFKREGYVLTNQSGLLLVKKDGTVVSGLEGSTPVAKQAKALRTADQVLAELRSAG
ncbi:hypothetical protein [Kribbella catacumbae]|uniref:hypothetical protein n=1 Tax=Kribbella catacumbae TaxID=460086 RepID=UPI00038126FC|nr:hypothetical protein [Kribbella catacumbae]